MTKIVKRRLEIAGQSANEDRMLAMIAALASELTVTRERLDTVERLAEAAGLFDRAAIEGFSPQAGQVAERDGIRRRIIDRVFRPIKDAAATLAEGA
ncbi:hypothetical protein SAMN05444678_10640 [Sphingomonas sp. YR710]|jgi:hypothetical protein|uniref:hypothetical protein n=1 Tax=Sphingomonas sp. YR710 TaxID=1882773 RepID=UPI00088C45E6|nr:hypothetical protein [Sphingomonas sp. YR710]SDC82813.1 hypothetical protein SAMN05444678_10640 [Sphingomonas sp. YR710]